MQKRYTNSIVTHLADLPFYTEGPAVDAANNFYCTTLKGGTIVKIDSNGTLSEWAKATCPNGQIILPNGDHLVCDSATGYVIRFDPFGKLIGNETKKIIESREVQVPNDLITDRLGNLYFTDSIRHEGKIFYLGVDGEERVFAENLDYPNGLVLSSDEKTLFVAESYTNRILQFNLDKPGYVKSEMTVLANLPSHQSGNIIDNLPDGLAMNAQGEIAVAHYGMGAFQLLSAEGLLDSTVLTGLPKTSNLIFLTETTLLVTGGYAEPGPGALLKIILQ